jgi:mRNA interferase RelE/StbE
MKYEVKWTKTSLDQLKKLDKNIAKRVMDKVEEITKNPFNFVKKLKQFNLFRLRVRDYRVIMSIENKKMIIFVLEVGHRSVIYRNY